VSEDDRRTVESVIRMLATLPDGRTLSWSPDWPYLTGDRALVAEAHAWLANRRKVVVTPTRPFVEATLADPVAAYIAMRTVAPGAAWQGIPTLTHPTPAEPVRSRAELPFGESPQSLVGSVCAECGSPARELAPGSLTVGLCAPGWRALA
jgi:hypothetical protein